ncbi:hypothetical protein EDD17DRAFT_173723 [Pisolithus thermaeus]|nr:hypothetical protein EV401DRAFT_898493 [Pisolithus croceorrhizus]KAI6165576.1 hypothetical protein EDD17DRAFT_173723 [Pisolithus thermaeus]
MTDWLESKFTNKCHSAILFLYSLDLDPTSGDNFVSWHLEAFAKAFRNKLIVPSDVYVVPTSELDAAPRSETLNQRLSQLKNLMNELNGDGERDWHASVFPGVFRGQPETAWSAALLLLRGITQAQTKDFFVSVKPALKRMPPKSPDARLAMKDLADTLFKEFKKKVRNRDLDAIIVLGKIALEFTPPEHPQRRSALIDLAGLLSERFNKEGREEDLDELITLKRAASEYMSPDEPQRQTLLLELDDHLSERFKQTDSMVDLEEIISLRRAVLKRVPSPNRFRALFNLANALHELFQRQGTESSIDEAVSLAQAALDLYPAGHPDHVLSRDHLASYPETKVGKETSRVHVKELGASPSGSSSSDIKRLIKKVVSDKVEKIPLRLLHTPTGVLCDRDAQISRFEGSPQYRRLLSLPPSLDNRQLDTEINNVI